MNYIAIDIGGTKIKYGIIDDLGKIYEDNDMDTEAYKGANILIEKVENIITDILNTTRYVITGIAISTAGQVDSKKGEIIFATEAIPGYTGVKLKKIIEEKFKLPCNVENDVNCAALGELWMGVAKGKSDFICLTIGTGIGGAIIMDGKVFTGNNNSAGEFGHINLYPQGIECNCGQKGCFERYASTSALVKSAGETFKIAPNSNNINGKIIFDSINNGESMYEAIVDKWCYDIALGLKSIIHIFNPGLIVIGGGVSAQGEKLISRIEKNLRFMVMPSFIKDLEIKTAECGNMAGMLGAVYSFK